MTEVPRLKEALSPEEMENVRVGYQVAVNLWWYLGDLVWAKYNAMLVVNSVVVAAIGIGLTSQQSLPILTVGLSVMGLFLCMLWFQLVKRGIEHYLPYIYAAREFEEKYLCDQVTVISRGNKFASDEVKELRKKKDDSGRVSYEIGGKSKGIRMTLWGRLLKTETTAFLVIGIFAVVYVLMLIQAL